MTGSYHHGDLPVALRAAAVDVIAERGAASFSLREVARRAGVSHAAPAHHFGDATGLLSSVAAEGYRTLSAAMRAAADGVVDPHARLLGMGRAYVQTALANPGHYAVMVDQSCVNEDDPELIEASLGAYLALHETMEYLRDQLNPDFDVDAAGPVMWAAVHGIVELEPILGRVAETTGTRGATVDELLVQLTDLAIGGIPTS